MMNRAAEAYPGVGKKAGGAKKALSGKIGGPRKKAKGVPEKKSEAGVPAVIEVVGTVMPVEITSELLDKICYHIATEDDGAKATAEKFGTTVGKLIYFLTKKGNEEAMARYQMAKVAQLERIGEEIIEMADTASNENFKFMRIKIDARQWVLSRLLPKYSDQKNVKMTHSVETYEERLRRLRGK